MGSAKRKVFQLLANRFVPRIGYFLGKSSRLPTFDYQTHLGRIRTLQQNFMKFWQEHDLDLIVCPGFGCHAHLHGKASDLGLAGAYVILWNVLDMVAGSLPVTTVKEDELHYESVHDDQITTALRSNMVGAKGLPVGVQVVGLPYQEEKVLRLMRQLERGIRFYEKHPLPMIN